MMESGPLNKTLGLEHLIWVGWGCYGIFRSLLIDKLSFSPKVGDFQLFFSSFTFFRTSSFSNKQLNKVEA